jgi:acyl carrier protein
MVFSTLSTSGPKELSNDIFVFDATSKRLMVLILGARFNSVRLSTLQKVLSRLNEGKQDVCERPDYIPQTKAYTPLSTPKPAFAASVPVPEPAVSKPGAHVDREHVFNDVCLLLERVAEVPRGEIKSNISLDDLGIDSLMMVEVISALSGHFGIDLAVKNTEYLTDLDSLVGYLLKRGCGENRGSVPSSGTTTMATTPSSSSSIKVSGGPPSGGTSTPADGHESQKIQQLANLLQEHLELTSAPNYDANLAEIGLDSLQAIELGNDIEKLFSVSIDLHQLDETSSFQDLAHLAGLDQAPLYVSADELQVSTHFADITLHPTPVPLAESLDVSDVRERFDQVRFDIDEFTQQEGFTNFWRDVYPHQNRLVLSYTADAFKKLGAGLACIPAGQALPKLSILEKHKHLLERMYKVLIDGGYIDWQQSLGYTRTSKLFDLDAPPELLKGIISDFPLHASEHRLLDVTGSKLAECLTGNADPLALLFANKKNRQILADVYELAPMCRAATRLLARFMARAFPPNNKGEVFHFLEVGGGTGKPFHISRLWTWWP